MFNMKQLQAVYERREMFAFLAYQVLIFLFDCKLQKDA